MLLMKGMMVTIRMLMMMRLLPSLTWFMMMLMILMEPLLAANVPWAF